MTAIMPPQGLAHTQLYPKALEEELNSRFACLADCHVTDSIGFVANALNEWLLQSAGHKRNRS